jgi:hypothetical protein
VWTAEQHKDGPTAVSYWLLQRLKYPNLSQMALDLVTIPASSTDCERVFSGASNTAEPHRRKKGSELFAALLCVQQWARAGYTTTRAASTYNEERLIADFKINEWEEPLPTTP